MAARSSLVRLLVVGAGFALAGTALAQEGGLLDVDLGDFDLSDNRNQEQTITYEGQVSQTSDKYRAGTPVTITHGRGNVSVRCTDSPGITARIQFSVEGTREDAMKRVGDGIGIRTSASSSSGSVTTSVPSLASGVKSVDAPLVVSLPLQARVTVTASNGWVQVLGCTGTVKASAPKGGVFVDGVLSSFDVTSGTGDVEIDLEDAAEITASSRATASGGNLTVRMPLTQKGTLTATGQEVVVAHLVSGVNTDTRVQGTLVDKGPAITLAAPRGRVEVSAPK